MAHDIWGTYSSRMYSESYPTLSCSSSTSTENHTLHMLSHLLLRWYTALRDPPVVTTDGHQGVTVRVDSGEAVGDVPRQAVILKARQKWVEEEKKEGRRRRGAEGWAQKEGRRKKRGSVEQRGNRMRRSNSKRSKKPQVKPHHIKHPTANKP